MNGISVTNLCEGNVKVSTIENASESAQATGGKGNNRLISWDYSRTAKLTLQDALLSDTSLAMLAGTTVKNTNITAVGREKLTLVADGTDGSTKVTLAQTPASADSVTVFAVDKGIMTDEITGFTIEGKDVKFKTGQAVGKTIMVFYQYKVTDTAASMITFSGANFPSTYKVVGDTVVRGDDGIDRKMQFIIPKAKLQSSFNLQMEAENVSTFDFTLDVLVDVENGNKLYDIIRL